MEGGDGPQTHLGRVGDGTRQGSPSPTLLSMGTVGGLLSELHGNVASGRKLRSWTGGQWGTGRGSSRIPPPPRTLHQKDTYLQPIGPCRATVTFEARLSLERVVGNEEEMLLGRGTHMLSPPPPPWSRTPTPDLQAVGS